MNLKLPAKLIESFIDITPVDEDKFEAAHQNPPVISVRLNPYKPISSFDDHAKVPWSDGGRYLNERPNFTADPLLHAGCYYVQEASSMFLEYALKQLIDFNQQLLALDLCAAPGGKSTLLSSLLNDRSLLISNEVISTRATILTENLTKWGKLNTWVTSNDPKHFSPLKNVFDLVLVDAPCSGSGLFRKMPAFANDWNMDTVHLCSQRQQRILHDVIDSVKDNGILVYMTCSFCEDENEEIVDRILEEFEVDSCQLDVQEEWGIVETESKNRKGFGYRFFPHLLQGEGFFIACFRKKELDREGPKIDLTRKVKARTDATSLEAFVDLADKYVIVQNDLLILIESAHTVYADYFSKYLKLIKKGILCGKQIRTELIPEHELALYADIRKDINAIELSFTDAIRYLQKENFDIACPSKGWYVVRYAGYNLGWIKNVGNRINNYYPSNYRILNRNILLNL